MAGDSSTNAPAGVTTAVIRANGAAQPDATGITVAWMFPCILEA